MLSVCGAFALLACSAGGDPAGSGSLGPGTPGGSAGTGGISVRPSTGVDPLDMRDLPIRKRTCDAGGNCTCLRLALLGTLDSAANQKDTRPFMDWLNGNSEGTAAVTLVLSKPTLDAAFLAQYDVLLIANVNSWTFSSQEKAAVEQWVRQSGGGIVTLTGFDSTEREPSASSQLVEFSGIRFQPPKSAENGQSTPVYYQEGTTDLKNCLSWSGSSEAIITTPIQFQPQMGALGKLTFSLDYVGAFIGWGVAAPSQATVVATDPITGSNMAVALEVDGTGRIFAFGDEWVIFANQWAPQGNPHNQQMDQHNPCWQPAAGNAAGFFHSVQTLYQTKQFWYNAISWVAPPNECNFVITDPHVAIPE